jgi:nucleoside-diphosphate-sugar epimerase
LPLGGVKNIRAMIALENLIDFIAACIENENAKGESFLIADKQHFSTAELIAILAHGMNKQVRLFSLSPGLLHTLFNLTRQEEKYQQLCGNLQMDTQKARTLLTWDEPITATSALEKAAGLFIASQNHQPNSA